MVKLFRKFRLKRANEMKKVKEEPKVRRIQDIVTHRRKNSEVETIQYFLCKNTKRKAAYRMILNLDEDELQKNIFLISKKLLEIVLSFRPMDILFYRALRRIVCLENNLSIHDLLMDYFVASVLCGSFCKEFGMFLMKYFPDLVLRNKERFITNIQDEMFRKEILCLKAVRTCQHISFWQRVLVLRDKVIVDAVQR